MGKSLMFQVSIAVLIVYICLVCNSCAGVRQCIPNDDVCALCHSNVEGSRRKQNADNAVKAKQQGNYSEFLSILQLWTDLDGR